MGAGIHPWRIHVNVWQNKYSIVKQNKVKIKIKKKEQCYLMELAIKLSLAKAKGELWAMRNRLDELPEKGLCEKEGRTHRTRKSCGKE